MSFTLTAMSLLLLLLIVVVIAAVACAVIAAPWTGGPARPGDHTRIGWAMIRFDFWLEWYGVFGRRRRDLRDELRGNLYEASAEGGSARAVTALGPLRALAADYARPATGGRDWTRGGAWAGVASVALVIISLAASLTWVDAVLASGAERVAGRPWASPWLYHELAVDHGDSLAVTTQLEGWILLAPALCLLVGARVWRKRSPRTTVAA